MEVFSTEFIVTVTVGLFKWAVALTLAGVAFTLVCISISTVWSFIFPQDPEEKAHAEDILNDIRLRSGKD